MDDVEIHRDSRLGLHPCYFHEGGSTHAPTIAGLIDATPLRAPRPDPEGLRQYFDRRPDGRRTCFEQVGKVPAHHRLIKHANALVVRDVNARAEPPLSPAQLLESLLLATESILRSSRQPALALSGGLDSAFLLALCRRLQADVTVVTLATSLPGYCEREITLAAAKSLGCQDVLIIEAAPADFVEATPAAIAAAETPLYNLHPVSKWLLARRLRQLGFDAIITGDGADQVFAGLDSRNYLPIIGAMAQAAGITLACPYLDSRIIDRLATLETDPDKTILRRLAAEWLPPEMARRPKQPRLAPDFDLSSYRTPAADDQLSAVLGQPAPPRVAGPSNTLWATATLLYQQLGGFD
jgi:asparagine synthetase B (glutamine-hydrolysing)